MTTGAILEVTPLAAQKLGEILKSEGEEGAMLRVMVMPGPHGGIQYMLGIEREPQEGDVVIDAGAVHVVVDSESAPLLEGSKIDYVEDLMRSGFIIDNPNVSHEGCGCGGACACGGGGCGCGGH